MAVTNRDLMEIATVEAVKGGLITPEEELHTYSKWKQLGFQVQKGEKAIMDTQLWKPCKKGKAVNEETGEETVFQKMILVKSYLFSSRQVKPV